jgi:ribonuclease BN (tRNA processing enzyme)
MKLTVIGSGDAFNASGRGHACYVVESTGAGRLMLDFGATALLGMRRAGLEPTQLDGILFTHLHGDHIGGFPFLVIDALFNPPRTRTLAVLGPVRTRATLHALMQVTYGDLAGKLDAEPFQLAELAPGDEREYLGYRVQAFAADHMAPPQQPLCLRVTDPAGKSIAFSGDTRPCAGLFAAGSGVDLLVAECTRMTPPVGQHCTYEDWRAARPTLTAKTLLLTHLGADVRAQIPRLLLEASGTSPPLHFADDGMVLEI